MNNLLVFMKEESFLNRPEAKVVDFLGLGLKGLGLLKSGSLGSLSEWDLTSEVC